MFSTPCIYSTGNYFHHSALDSPLICQRCHNHVCEHHMEECVVMCVHCGHNEKFPSMDCDTTLSPAAISIIDKLYKSALHFRRSQREDYKKKERELLSKRRRLESSPDENKDHDATEEHDATDDDEDEENYDLYVESCHYEEHCIQRCCAYPDGTPLPSIKQGTPKCETCCYIFVCAPCMGNVPDTQDVFEWMIKKLGLTKEQVMKMMMDETRQDPSKRLPSQLVSLFDTKPIERTAYTPIANEKEYGVFLFGSLFI